MTNMISSVFFRARVLSGDPAEGLTLARIGAERVAVEITLDGRTQRVTIARHDALDLAAVLRSRLARRRALRVVEPVGGAAA